MAIVTLSLSSPTPHRTFDYSITHVCVSWLTFKVRQLNAAVARCSSWAKTVPVEPTMLRQGVDRFINHCNRGGLPTKMTILHHHRKKKRRVFTQGGAIVFQHKFFFLFFSSTTSRLPTPNKMLILFRKFLVARSLLKERKEWTFSPLACHFVENTRALKNDRTPARKLTSSCCTTVVARHSYTSCSP